VRSNIDREYVSVWLVAAVGAVSAVLFVIGGIALGTPPSTEQTGVQVVEWFREQHTSLRWYVFAVTANTPLLAFFFAWLRQCLPPLLRDVFLLGAAMLLVALNIQAWTFGGLSVRPMDVDPAVARTVLDVAVFFGPVLTGTTITMMAPVTWTAFTEGSGLPGWLGLLGIVVITEQAVEMVTIFGSTGFTAPGGAMNMQLGAGLFTLWLVAFVVCRARLTDGR
jgi:hypothetical protein